MSRLPVNTYSDDLIPRLEAFWKQGGTTVEFAKANRLEYKAFQKWLSREGVYRHERPYRAPTHTVLHTGVSIEMRDTINRVAKDVGLSQGEVVRQAIEEFLQISQIKRG